MKVVISAISTIIVNSVGEMTPRSSPMLSTMSSIRPRVFISTPRAVASCQRRPVSRAATVLPPNLPRHATPTTRPHIPHALAESSRPTWVRRPL